MAFLNPVATGAGDGGLYAILFTQYLKLTPCLSPSSKYGCFTGDPIHDLIFNLLLPHMIIIAFIWTSLSAGFITNKGIQTLAGIVTYIVIIGLGWYPFLAATMVWWFIIMLGVNIFKFMSGRFGHPSEFQHKQDRAVIKALANKTKKDKRKDLKEAKEELAELQNEYKTADEPMKKQLAEDISNKKREIKSLEKMLRR